ncbi:sulfur carrier protein [Amaricoccus macauensis]|uniref:Sulfur carrier protein n=1 Tax=Amaricoccus macauensis TaxID=57001 RepID=A0A840SW44_9RHOB|nr:sulfur carrier protein ThiS [Amaricoccus macauensis]MBB5223371.1 sulfur carrier protein [Amaricoccus macauensis]
MKIELNGEAREVSAGQLAEALVELGYGGATVATAVNGAFVPVAARAERILSEGDRLEVLAPRQGG